MPKKFIFNQKALLIVHRFFKWIIAAVAVLILIGGYFLVIKDGYQRLKKSQDVDLVKGRESITELRQRLAELSGYANETVAFTPTEEHLLALVLPDEFDFSSIVIQLTALAEKNNFLVEGLDLEDDNNNQNNGKPNVVGQLHKVKIRLKVIGDNYNDFRNFLAALETSVMLVDVISVSFSPETSNYELNLMTYYYQ